MHTKSALIAAAAALVIAGPMSAQDVETQVAPKPGSSWEFLIPSGTLVPTGAQRDAIRRGNISAAQLTYVARPGVAIMSTFGWARSRDVATSGNPKLDVFTYDVGAELRAARWIDGSVTFTPFAGAGAGGRSYNHRKLELDATHNLSAYGSVGGELGYRRVRLRVEARDYVSGLKPLAGVGSARTGNDVVVMAGLRLVGKGR